MTDTITPAFLDIVKDGGPAVQEALLRSTERHRILGGKSARMLRRGDRVALRDLNPDLDGEAHLVRGSRLVLVARGPEQP